MTKVQKSRSALIVSIVAAVLSAITSLALLIGIVNTGVTTKTLNSFDYKNGAIDTNGKVVESNLSAVSNKAQTVKDMSIEIDEDNAIITYKVAFYDEDGEFVSMTEQKTQDFDVNEIPEAASTFKVVITPNEVDGEAVKLNSINRAKYVNQLKVVFARE